MQQTYTQPAIPVNHERKNSNILIPEAFGEDHGFPVFDDLMLDT